MPALGKYGLHTESGINSKKEKIQGIHSSQQKNINKISVYSIFYEV